MFIVKTERKVFLDEQILRCLVSWKPKRAGRIQNLFSLSIEDDAYQYVRKPISKDDENLRTKAPKTQSLVIHMCCDTNVYILKTNKEGAAECAKLLA